MSEDFDPSVYCELCGKKTNKENINAHKKPGFIHYCDACRNKILKVDIEAIVTDTEVTTSKEAIEDLFGVEK